MLVEPEKVKQSASKSFDLYVSRKITNANSDLNQPLTTELKRVVKNFENELDQTVESLLGDGLLDVSEVKESLGALRNRYQTEVETVVSAVQDGHPPPPLRSSDLPSTTYLKDLIRYSILIRNSPRSWMFFIGFVIAGLIVAWAINKCAYLVGAKINERGFAGIASVLRSLAGPLYLAAISTGLQLGLNSLWIPETIRQPLHGFVGVLIVFALFWFFWNACPGFATGLLRLISKSYTHSFDEHAHNIILRCLRILVVVLLVLMIVRVIMNTSLSSMLTGLGVLGVALYFVLRGTIENIAASFTLFSDQPFRVGNIVVYEGQWGIIEDIGFRSTQFRTYDGHLISIPNSKLIDVPIENAEKRPSIRRRFHIGLTYETTPQKVREAISIIENILDNYEGMPEDSPAKVVFEKFGSYDLQLLVRYYYEPADYWKSLEFDTQVNLQILEKFAEAGIDIAYPTERHITDSGSDGKIRENQSKKSSNQSGEVSRGTTEESETGKQT